MSIYTKTAKKEKNCIQCGHVFIAFRDDNYSCSKKCFDKFLSEKRKSERKEIAVKVADRICKQCLKTYAATTNRSNFCSVSCGRKFTRDKKRVELIASGISVSIKGRPQSESHKEKRAASVRFTLSKSIRKCIKCNEEYTPTLAAQKYCSGRCWQSQSIKKRKSISRVSIPKEQYQILFDNQNGKCKICGTESGLNNRGDKLAVDHCHSSGKIRGLLCHKCNTALGLFKDNIDNLKIAIEYLNEK